MNHSVLHKRIIWITETAIMLALLIAVQAVTAGLGNQFVTGSCVNLILAVTALIAGLWSSIIVAGVSPFVAFLFGIGPKFLQLVPAVAAGNLVYVILLYFLMGKGAKALWQQSLGLAAAALAKFAVLFLLVTQLLVPSLVNAGVIPAKAAATISATFSWPQLVTAVIGGAAALLIVPVLKKALKRT